MQTSTKKKLKDFLRVSSEFKLGQLDTERCHLKTKNLSTLAQKDIYKAIDIISSIDLEAIKIIEKQLGPIQEVREEIEGTIDSGGRVFICGCGATGRLALTIEKLWLDECKAKNNGLDNRVVSFMAGGDVALIRSIENFEDFPDYGARQLMELGFSENDLLISCTEGGETPFVIGATEKAIEVSKRNPFFLYCNKNEILSRVAERSRVLIQNSKVKKVNLITGPMALSGSTRLQASTVQMLFVGFALFSNNEIENDLDFLVQFLKGRPCLFLKKFIEKEAYYLRKNRFLLYSTDENLGITVLTDTTERAPTFNLNPFENFKDNYSIPSNFYLFFSHSKNAIEAWELLLGRKPRTFLWKDVTKETCYDRLTGFDFSNDLISKRSSLGIKHEFFSIHQEENGLLFKLGDLEHYLLIEKDKPLILHVILKIVLNTLSTLVMGKLGRFQGNLMTWVRPSNNKLIDRAIRYSQILLEERGIFTSYENIARACFITLEQEQWNRSLVMEIVKRIEIEEDKENFNKSL